MHVVRYTLALIMLFMLQSFDGSAQELKWEPVQAGIEFENTQGVHVDFPFSGGFGAYKFQLVDIDNDGDDDVFQKETEGRLLFYECLSNEEMRYALKTSHYENLDVPNWFRFADVDDDGDQDLFRGNRQGFVTFSKNVGTPLEPAFTEAIELVDSDNNSIRGDINSFPSFFDVDCDNDTDMLLGDVAGTVSYYSLVDVDAEGIPVYQLETTRFQDLFIVTGEGAKKPSDEIFHGANAFAFVDLFDDGAPALLWGDYFSSRLLMFDNEGTCGDMQLDTNFTLFPPGSPLQTSGFNAPAVGYVNNDNIPDIFVGIGGGAVENNNVEERPYNRVQVFFGSESTPGTFTQTSDQLFSTVDVGDRSAPTFVDIDNDGDNDVVIGNQAESESGLNSNLYFFRNTASDASPVYTLVSDEFAGTQSTTFAQPAFVDIDADGDYDLFVGGFNGRLMFQRNVGSAEVAIYDVVSDFYQGIDVGSYAAPAFIDADRDGDADLVIGNSKGELLYFQNEGDAVVANFSEPVILPIDIGANAVPSVVALTDSSYLLCVGASDADSLSCFEWRDMQLVKLKAPSVKLSYSHPAMQRIGDRVHMLLGTSAGGVFAYETDVISTVIPSDTLGSTVHFSSENNSLVVSLNSGTIEEYNNIEVYTLTGRRLSTTTQRSAQNEVVVNIRGTWPNIVFVRVGTVSASVITH